MRVLHVNKFLYRRGGAEVYMEEAAELMAADGHQVGFFGMAHTENTRLEFARHFPREVDLRDTGGGVLAKAAVAARMVWSQSARAGMAAVLDEFRPDVVHLHNIYHQLSPSVLAPIRARGIRAVMTLHDFKLACPSYQFLDHGQLCTACLDGRFSQAVRRRCKDESLAMSALVAVESTLHRRMRAYAPVSLFLCPSQFLLSKMVTAQVFPQRMRHLPNFVADLGPAAGDPRGPVVVACRLSKEKGVDTLVRAAAQVPEGTEVVVAGEGPESDALQQLAAEVAPGRVRFAGRLEKDATVALLRSASVVVVPSRWYENQPMILIEALSLGVPVVGSRLGGIAELIRDGVDGATVPHDDPSALAAAIVAIRADPDRWSRLSAAARARYAEDFSPSVHRDRLLDAYGVAARHDDLARRAG